MANLINRINGKNEAELNAKIAELEKKLEATTAELAAQTEQSKMHQANAQAAVSENTQLKTKLEKTEKELAMSNSAYFNMEAKYIDSESKLKSEIAEMEKRLKEKNSKIEELNQKLSEAEATTKAEHEKLVASYRSLELSKPENSISDNVIPTKEDFIKLRDSVYNDYKAAQDAEIKKILEAVKSYDDTAKISIKGNPSFTFHYPDGSELTFIIPEVVKKLYNVFNRSGWRTVLNFKHSSRDLTDMVLTGENHMLLLFGQAKVTYDFFPSPKCMKPIQDEKQIIAICPGTDCNKEDFETRSIKFYYEFYEG